MTRATKLFLLALFVVALVFPFLASNQFTVRLAIVAGVFILLASAHNLLMKVGQLSLGPVAFYGLGAYTSAILTSRYDVPFLLAFLAAGIVATFFGWLIGRLTLRMRTAYFVLVTLGFAEFFRLVALNWTELTNGPMGITAVPPPAAWFRGYTPYYYFILVLVVVVLYGLYRMEHSTIGRAMRAIRENEPLAQSVGVSSYHFMMLAALLSSFIIGIAGSFYAHFFQFVGPEILAFDLTITIVVMVIAGGRATLAGPVLGAIVFTVLPEVLRTAQSWRMAIYGLLLMLIMLFMPDGILPALQNLWQRIWARRWQRQPEAVVPTPSLATAVAPNEPVTVPVEHSPLPPEQGARGPSPAPDGGARAEIAALTPLLRVRDLCVYFGGVHAVEEVSFDVDAGEILAIIGPNGAGKTTILNAITRFGPITHGEIHHQDTLLNALQPHEIAQRGIVRTFQHTSLFPNVTTRRNLVLAHTGMEPETLRTNLLRTTECVDAEQKAEAVAEEILAFTHLDRASALIANSLPYGNQRLLEMGIALAPQPDILLLDEPAAGMNPNEVMELMGLIRQIRDKGITIVLVEHDMRLVMGISDRIVVLDYGKKIAEGKPEEIRANERVVEAYLGRRREHAAD